MTNEELNTALYMPATTRIVGATSSNTKTRSSTQADV